MTDSPRATVGAAIARLEGYLSAAVAVLPVPCSLRRFRAEQRRSPDPETGDYGAHVELTRGYWLDGIGPDHVAACFEAIHDHWIDAGFVVVSDARPDGWFLSVANPADLYRMSLVASDAGTLSISATSSRVLPDDLAPEGSAPTA